jgi:type I restriction enzyme S subunit
MTQSCTTDLFTESGIEWVGRIPNHWSVRPFYAFAGEVRHPNIGLKERNLLSLSYGRLVRKDIDRLGGLTPASFEGYNIIEAGDIVFRLTDLQNDHTSLRSARAHERGIITSAYVTVRPKVNSRFFEYLMRSYDTTKVFYGVGGGIRQSMKFADLKRLPVVVPPEDEMESIASYLDRTTARVDTLIAKKTRFIDLLHEKRQALIAHAVTKGLDDRVQTKDCGVEWLGKVPETWSVAPLRVFLRLRRDIVGTESANIKLLSLTLQGVIERDLENPTGKMPASFDGYQRIAAGEMVFCLFDMDETPRTVGVAPQDGMLTGAYTVFRPQSELWARYLYYFFLHVDEYKRLRPFYKGLRKTIRPGPFLSIQVPRPSEEEAREIVGHLDHNTARIDTMISKTERSIELLREHRTALITYAVIGKVGPRKAA